MSLEYYVKETNNAPHEFEVAKFEGGAQPEEVYRVLWNPAKLFACKCDCMAWRSKKTRPCKHQKMVQDFIGAGKPQPFLWRQS